MKDHLPPLDLPSELDGLIALASRIEKRLADTDRQGVSPIPSATLLRSNFSITSPGAALDMEEIMQIRRTWLSLGGFLHLLCSAGTLLGWLPSSPRNASHQAPMLVSSTLLRNKSCQWYISVTLTHDFHTCSHPVLVDSGKDLAKKLKLAVIPLDAPLSAITLDRSPLCPITHHTSPVTPSFADSHPEKISFHLFNTTQHSLNLGYH